MWSTWDRLTTVSTYGPPGSEEEDEPDSGWDEGCGPSRECFHVDLGGHDEGNHLGMPEDDDPPRPAPRVDILWELAVVPVPAGGQDT
jgi:hypothetical protein